MVVGGGGFEAIEVAFAQSGDIVQRIYQWVIRFTRRLGLSTQSRKGLKITEECWKAEVISRLGNPVSMGARGTESQGLLDLG